jgi:hypothetical protein
MQPSLRERRLYHKIKCTARNDYESVIARISDVEKSDAPWYLRLFYFVMREMFGKDLVALIAMLLNRWHSDRTRERRWHAAFPLFMAAAGFFCLVGFPNSTVMTVSPLSMICVVMAFLPVFWAIPTEMLSESTAAVAVGTINALASLADFAGPHAFGFFRRWIRAANVLHSCGGDTADAGPSHLPGPRFQIDLIDLMPTR